MRPVIRHLILGAFVFVIALAATIPAHLLARYLPEDIYVEGVEGTVWDGHAARLEVRNFDAGEVDWRLRPLYLFMGRLGFHVTLDKSKVTGTTTVEVSPFSTGLRKAALVASSDILNGVLEPYGGRVTGDLFFDLPVLKATSHGPEEAEGTVQWQGAQLTSPTRLPFGNVRMNLTQEGDTAIGRISNDGNQIRLEGEIRVGGEWGYQARLKISPTATTPSNVRQALQLLGRPDENGAVKLHAAGNLLTLLQ